MGKSGVSCPICRSRIKIVEGTPVRIFNQFNNNKILTTKIFQQFALSQKDVMNLKIALHTYNYYANLKKFIKVVFLIIMAILFATSQIAFVKDNIVNV